MKGIWTYEDSVDLDPPTLFVSDNCDNSPMQFTMTYDRSSEQNIIMCAKAIVEKVEQVIYTFTVLAATITYMSVMQVIHP